MRRTRRSTPSPRRARSPSRARGRLRRPLPWAACAALLLLVLLVPPLRRGAATAGRAVLAALAEARAAEARARLVDDYARRYGIPRSMAAAIERAARAEQVPADLAFRLVRVESGFDPAARSPVGAIGLTQMMLPTALELQPGITPAHLYQRDTNLRLGFRYFHRLLRLYPGDVPTALHAYNRGMGTVARIRAAGRDPANGYADRVLGDAGASPVGPVAPPPPSPAGARVDELGPARLPAGR